MVESILGSSNSNTSKQIQDFLDGKVNITKSDLQNTVSSAIAQGEEPSDTLLDILDSYDKIDTNGDGLSYEELKTYKNTSAGMLSSLGLSAESLKRKQLDLFVSAFLKDDSTASSSSLFGSTDLQDSLLGDYSSDSTTDSTSADSSNSYLDSVLQAYSSSNTSNTSSILDYIT